MGCGDSKEFFDASDDSNTSDGYSAIDDCNPMD